MTGPKELALFTAAAAAVVLLSGEASGQDFRQLHLRPPPFYQPRSVDGGIQFSVVPFLILPLRSKGTTRVLKLSDFWSWWEF